MTDCCLHASNLQLTNQQGQEIGDITQVLDPGVEEIDKCSVLYPAGELPAVDVPVGNVSRNSCVEYPSDKITGVDVSLGEVAFPVVDKDFDAKNTGVEVKTGAYGGTHDAVTVREGL